MVTPHSGVPGPPNRAGNGNGGPVSVLAYLRVPNRPLEVAAHNTPTTPPTRQVHRIIVQLLVQIVNNKVIKAIHIKCTLEKLAAAGGDQIGSCLDACGKCQNDSQNGLLEQVNSPVGGGLTTMPTLLLPHLG